MGERRDSCSPVIRRKTPHDSFAAWVLHNLPQADSSGTLLIPHQATHKNKKPETSPSFLFWGRLVEDVRTAFSGQILMLFTIYLMP